MLSLTTNTGSLTIIVMVVLKTDRRKKTMFS